MNLASVSYWEYISVHKGPGELLFVVTVSVSFQDSRVLVLGDSHVRRLAEREYLINDHLQGVLLTWRFLPGGYIEFAEYNIRAAFCHQIVVLMLGGNDLDNGCSEYQLADRVIHVANSMILHSYYTEAVIITSLWPRSSQEYNRRARLYAALMERRLSADTQVVFWLWDRRQPWRNTDGTHFTQHGYDVAMRYLVAPIVWAINHIQW